MRIRSAKTELQDAGLDAENMASSTSKLREQILALAGVDIMQDENTFKSTIQILRELAAVWQDLEDIEQASVLELIAGKRQGNQVASALNNWNIVEEALTTSLNSQNSALAENQKYLDSIQGKIDIFNNSLQTLYTNILSSDFIKFVVEAGTAILNFLNEIGPGFDILLGVLTSIVALPFFKALKIWTNDAEGTLTFANALSKSFRNLGLILNRVAGAISPVISGTVSLRTALQSLWATLSANPLYLIAAAIAAAALAFDHFHTTAQEAADKAKESFDDIQNLVDSTKSTVQSLETELSTIQDKIDKLNDSKISYADSQELEKLQAQRSELEHSLKIQQQILELQQESRNKQAIASMKAYTKAASEGAEETQETAKNVGTISGALTGVAIALGVLLAAPTGGVSLAATLGLSGTAIAGTGVAMGAAGGYFGNKAGEAIGSSIAANDGTYDNWYETYAKALETSRKEEQKALKDYQKDSSNIEKLDKWQEAQQKTADIETEMYGHLSQMQQYFSELEYGVSEEIDNELNTWYNFLDKLSIDQGASGAEVTALDRIFGENASKEIQLLKTQILEAISAGEEFNFNEAINNSEELNKTLNYIGLTTEDVKGYFDDISASAASAALNIKNINPIDTYSAITESISQYDEILKQTAEILGDNTQVTQEYKDSIVTLIGSAEEVNKYFDEYNDLIVTNADGLKKLITQNVKLKKAQSQLDYYNLVKQLNNTLKGTKQLDAATKNAVSSLLDQIDVVELAIYQYQQLEDSLLGAGNAFDKFAQMQEVDALNTYGDSYVEMAQTMYDAFYKTGEVGTEAMWAAIESLVPDSVYQGLTEDADRVKAIYEYYKKNILPTLKLDEDELSLDYTSIEKFVKKALDSGVFTGNLEKFDLVEGLNLEEAAEKLGYTTTQAYALFAELDKYNASGTALSFLSQLDDSFEGGIVRTTNLMEELNRQKLALLEDGGYDENKAAIDSINQQLSQCDANLRSASIEAYNMWKSYANNDVALDALSTIEDKQKEITQEAANTLGLEWNDVKGKTIQQVYDEILAKQQELSEPTELSVEFAKDYIDVELEDLKKQLEEKGIDIEANVVWSEKNKQYEAAEDSQYANTELLKEYIDLQNEGYVLENYFSKGMTATEGYLSNIQSILQDMYDIQSGKKTEDKTSDISIPDIDADIAKDIEAFFTETIPTYATEVFDVLDKFFTETIPQEWDAFWTSVGAGLDKAGEYAQELYAICDTFFKETLPQAWEDFWNATEGFLTEDVPYAIGYAAGAVAKFFTKTIPEKWNEFWNKVSAFLDDAEDSAEELRKSIHQFFTVTVPKKWNELWVAAGKLISEKIVPALLELKQKTSQFFTETIPEKWDEFWTNVENFFTQTIPNTIQQLGLKITEFFTTTVPTKWDEFWINVDQAFIEPIRSGLASISEGISSFFTTTLPEKFKGIWDSASSWISGKASEIWSNITAGFTAGFGGESDVNGTAHAHGTAHATGDWGLPKSEHNALVGELGQELVVNPHTGQYYTVGDNGAEFVDLPKDAIVFNHKQTEALLSKGYVTGRGKAYASGTAHANIFTKLWNGIKSFFSPKSVAKETAKTAAREIGPVRSEPIATEKQTAKSARDYSDPYTSNNSLWKPTNPSSGSGSGGGGSSKDEEPQESTFDFIEVKMEKIETLIEKITKKIALFLDDTSDINKKDKYYDQLVEAEKNKASTYLSAAEAYNRKAVELLQEVPSQYRSMAKNGAIAIEDFIGDDEQEVLDAINNYREYAQKADEAEAGYLESIAQSAAYRVEQLNDIATDFENLTNQIETQSGLVQSQMDLIEESGNIVSEKFYKDLMKKTKEQRSELVREKASLQKILDDSVKSGDVIVGTDEWFEMVQAIYDVDDAIIQCDIDLEKYQNSINDLNWESFERLLDQLDNIDSELSFISDLITKNDWEVVDENGNWTQKGITAMGMYAQQMEIAQTKVQQYGKEINELDRIYQKGLISQTEYNEKLAELKDGQRDAVNAYEDAKDAIVDLNKVRVDAIKDGLDKELDAYKKLIEKKKEALEADKD